MGGAGCPPEALSPSCPTPTPQLLQTFEDIPLCGILQQIQEKHDLQKVKKVRLGGFTGISAQTPTSRPPGGTPGSSHPCLKFFSRQR